MFEEGDYISYGCKGVCRVESITSLDVPGAAKRREYYMIRPVYEQNGIIYTPVDNKKVSAWRKILTKEEAESLLRQMPQLEMIHAEDRKLFEAECKKAVQSGDCVEWLRVIKTLLNEKKLRNQHGKKLTTTSEKYLKAVEEKLYGELAISFSVDKSQIEQLLEET